MPINAVTKIRKELPKPDVHVQPGGKLYRRHKGHSDVRDTYKIQIFDTQTATTGSEQDKVGKKLSELVFQCPST